MINCSRVEALFSACWEDELSLAERETLEAHITACAACRGAYDDFVRAMEAVQGLPRLEAEPGFTDAVLARVRAADTRGAARAALRTGRAMVWWSGWEGSFRPALAAAALAVVVGVGAYVVWSSGWISGSSRPTGVASRAAVPAAPARHPSALSSPAGSPAVALNPPAPAAPRSSQPVQVAARQTGRSHAQPSAALAARAPAGTAVVPDSLFDHSYDLEFAFDPVNLRRVPGEQNLRPARPMPASDVGRKASITF
jgi:anti-sigma factor RsiW